MDIVGVLVIVLVIGLLLWAVSALPLDPTWQQIARVLIIVLGVIWLLGAVGFLPSGHLALYDRPRCP